jgi:hypothetical protein
MSPRIAGALSRSVQGKARRSQSKSAADTVARKTVAKNIVYVDFAKYPKGETP